MAKYKSYNFVEEDPVLGILGHMRNTTKMTNREISDKSSVAPGTIGRWFSGKTKSPKFATAAAAASAMGFDSLPITAEARQRFRQQHKKGDK